MGWEGTNEEFEKKFGEVRLSDEWERKDAEREVLSKMSSEVLAVRYKENVLNKLDAGQIEMLNETLPESRGKMTRYKIHETLKRLQKAERLDRKKLSGEFKEAVEIEFRVVCQVAELNEHLSRSVSGVGEKHKKLMVQILSAKTKEDLEPCREANWRMLMALEI